MIKTLLSIGLAVIAVDASAQRSTLSALNPSANGTNFIVDLNKSTYLINVTNNVNFLQTTNRAASTAKDTTIFISSGTTNWTFLMNPSWRYGSSSNVPPTTLSSNKVAVLRVRSFGTNETNIFVTFSFQ
jgi:hypothetical protein